MTNTTERKERRAVLKGTLVAGAAVVAMPSSWKKPMVNAVLLPAHAQTSVVEVQCPMAVIGNVVTGPVSGQAQCTVTFDVLSSDPATPLTITDISNSTLVDPATVTYDSFGEATDTTGPRVVWQGPTTNAPFECTDPIDDVTFTISGTCSLANSVPFEQEVTLSSILSA